MDAPNPTVLAAFVTATLALASSIVSVALSARAANKVKKIELSYPFNKTRYDALIAFYNATGGRNPAQDIVNRILFNDENVSQEDLNKGLLLVVQSSVAIRDLYDENRHLFSKSRRKQLDDMLENIRLLQPEGKGEVNFQQKSEAFLRALAKFSEDVRRLAKQEIDELAEKLSSI